MQKKLFYYDSVLCLNMILYYHQNSSTSLNVRLSYICLIVNIDDLKKIVISMDTTNEN